MSLNAPPTATPPDVVIDTSVWVSRILGSDSNHQAALRWTNTHLLGSGTLISPLLFVTEVAATISRQTGWPAFAHAAVAQLYNLPGLRLVPIDQTLVDTATDLSADLGLRGADSLFVALAAQLNIPLVSFDNEQLQKPASLIQTIHP